MSVTIGHRIGRYLHLRAPQDHVVRNVQTHHTAYQKKVSAIPRYDQLLPLGELLQSGFRYSNLGAPWTWLQKKLVLLYER